MDISRNHPQWAALIEGKITHEFKFVSAAMMISRLSREYKRQPSEALLKSSIDEAIAFFEKFENLFKDDLNAIFK